MPDLRHDVEDREILEALARLADRTSRSGMRNVFAAIGRYAKASTQLRFRSQVGPDSSPWRASARARLEGGQTLRNTGRLRNSISWIARSDGVESGTNVKYAAVHQVGYFKSRQHVRTHMRLVREAFGRKLQFGVFQTVRPFVRRMQIPARPFLGLNDVDRQTVLAIVATELARTTRSQ